ncbi:Oxoglutarate/iron-dependent dioxygenase [Gracilaria domingensis]|nr:Oxoglutarate/iron-dependent dioxygenase [Gracilaria domingensis]
MVPRGPSFAFTTPIALSPRRHTHRRATDQRGAPLRMALPDNSALQRSVAQWGLNIDPKDSFNSISALRVEPPLLCVPDLLTPAQCDALIAAQSANMSESELYLNYRLNTDSRSQRCGFRSNVAHDEPSLQPVLEQIHKLLGFSDRSFLFAEQLWTRPTRRTVVIRDVTTVRYEPGEGVPAHVDGKDCTVLICLQEPKRGGRTIFPKDAVYVEQTRGTALIYHSKEKLLHYAEEVEEGTKWVLQLLIDFNVRPDELDVKVDYATGQVQVAS